MQTLRDPGVFSIQAEMAVIGGMLLDPDAILRASDVLETSDFYQHSHRVMFDLIRQMHDSRRPVEMVGVVTELQRIGQFENVGGAAYIGELWGYVPTAANIEYHANIVREKAQLRRLAQIGGTIGVAVKEGKTATEVQEEAERLIFAAGQRTVLDAPLVPIRDALKVTLEKLERNEPDVHTGFKDLDHLTGGFPKGDLVILAARPSMGKTACGLQWAVNIADNEKKPVVIFSLEMTTEALSRRMMFTEARVNGARFRVAPKDHEYQQLATAVGFLDKLPIMIQDRVKTPRDIRSHCRRLALSSGPLGAVVVDYLGKLRGTRDNDNRVQELGEITGDLKALAVELECPVFVLCQLSRAVEARPDKRPMLSDLRDSGEIEQDADSVVMLYRPEYYFGPTDKEGNSLVGRAELIVAKQRNGATGNVPMHFFAEFTRFEDFTNREQRGAA